jgi:hypothetical protein
MIEECKIHTWGDEQRAAFYPFSPPWLRNPDEMIRRFVAGSGVPKQLISSIVRNVSNQRESDKRYRLISQFGYTDVGVDAKLPSADHTRRFARFGQDLVLAQGTFTMTEALSKQQHWGNIEGWVAPADIAVLSPTVKCDHCDRVIDLADPPECICGENFCSVKCHQDAWKNHREICDTVKDNSELAFALTRRCWAMLEGTRELIIPRPTVTNYDSRTRTKESDYEPELDDINNRILRAGEFVLSVTSDFDTTDNLLLRDAMYAEVWWQVRYYSQVNPRDNPSKVEFKIKILTDRREMMGGLVGEQPWMARQTAPLLRYMDDAKRELEKHRTHRR